MIAGTEVRGLKEFRRELRNVNTKFPKELGAANAEAAEVVLRVARSNASRLGGGSRARDIRTASTTGKLDRRFKPGVITAGGVAAKVIARNGLRASKAASAVKVILGSNSVPYALGAEFGSNRFRQFKEFRGNQWSPDQGNVGYFLHPAIRDTREEFIETYADILMRLTRKAFPDG